MKQKTKNTNTFRFKSFADRINEIDLRQLALYHIGHEYEELPEENETYFHQTLKKWIVLNLSEEFTQFSRKCLKVVTLPQLIHQKDHVIGVILDHLATATKLSLQPILELVYVLARDLREEFYPYFQRVLDRLVGLLITQDAEQLEWTLICLAYLFKSLKSYLKKNVGVVFHAILPLLDERFYKSHVTNFAAECFSFIARDIKDHRRFLNFMLESVLREQVESVRGCGRLCFEIMRGIKGQFHSLAGEFLQFLFESLVQHTEEQSDKIQLLHDIVYQAILELFAFITPQNISLFWEKLCHVAQKAKNIENMPHLLHVFLLGVETREGRFISDLSILIPTIIKMLDMCQLQPQVATVRDSLKLLCDLVAKLLLAEAVQLTQLDTTRLLKKTLALPQRELYGEFILNISTHAQFELLVLPDVLAHFEQHFDASAFELLAALVMRKCCLAKNAVQLATWQPYKLQLKKQKTLEKLQNKLQQMNLVATFGKNENSDAFNAQIFLLLLLPHFNALRQVSLDELFEKQINDILPTLTINEPQIMQKLMVLAVLIETYIHLQQKFPKKLLTNCLQVLLPHLESSLLALRILDQLLYAADKDIEISLANDLKLQLSPLLSVALHEVRQLAANCLQALDTNIAPYRTFYEIACIEPTVHNYREQLLLLHKLETAGQFHKTYASMPQAYNYQIDTVRFLLGLLQQNFKLTWTPVQQLLQEYAEVLGRKKFWPIYKEKLQQIADAIAEQNDKESEVDVDVQHIYWHSNILNNLLPLPQNVTVTHMQLRNYRNLLWQQLARLTQIAETENRDIVTLFLRFINEEYKPMIEKREYAIDLTAMQKKLRMAKEADEETKGFTKKGRRKLGKKYKNLKVAKKVKQVDEKAIKKQEQEESHNEEEDENEELMEVQKSDSEEEEENEELMEEDEQQIENDDEEEETEEEDLEDEQEEALAHSADDGEDNEEEEKLEENVDAEDVDNKFEIEEELVSHRQHSATLREILETLSIKLGVFVIQPNPKALHRETELYDLYLELLKTPNAQLQKLALDCISAYKWSYITSYKTQLYAFIDEREFRKQLVEFQLQEVQQEERENFMHILLRILYGKMLTKGTQMAAQQRKSLILRFLGQCDAVELFWFLQMAFKRYNQYVQPELSLQAVTAAVQANFTLKEAWLPQRLHSMVNLLELMRNQFGGLLQKDFQLYMLKLLVFVGHACELILAATPTLHTAYKRVRNAALLSLVNFFAHITQFDWQQSQMQCLIAVFVWPNIKRLPMESIHTPTPLLKLLLQWGEQQRFFIYLNEQQKNEPVIFHYIVELLLHKHAKLAVRRPIMMLIERLLIANNEQNNIALTIIKPFILQILQRLRLNFNIKKSILQPRDLNILSLLTAHVADVETCESLLQLLLPVLIAKTQATVNAELSNQIIVTLSNLIKRLPVPEAYLIKLAPLFEHVQEVAARKLLCQLLTDIAKQRHKQLGKSDNSSVELRETARLIYLINAWDQRWVEQPDYDKRLDALKEVREKVTQNAISMQLGVLVAYNCFYFVRYDKDMGLRDNALEHLCLLLPKMLQQHAADAKMQLYVIEDVLFNWFKRSLRDSVAQSRDGSIKLLGVMARECADMHECFNDLAPLTDKLDAEVDFFENLTHLQSHRHGRALLKFCTHASTLKKTPNVRTLMQFLLPLTSRYLLNEKYAGKHTLIDAAIETVGVICQMLPWQQYHGILRYYFMKLRSAHEYQKQCVRIVVRILDAFHFDLKQADDTNVKKQLKTEGQKLLVKEDAVEKNLNVNCETTGTDVPILQQSILLHANAAKRVMNIITTVLIPTLNRAITEQSSYDTKHKLNRKRLSVEREEEEILRVPIALALVKLMQKLPTQVLNSSLPGVFIKVCTFLRSPLKSVRMLTRDILKKIVLTLGSKYLPLLIDHLQTLLTRGFQVHVLAVTVHGVLDALREQLNAEDVASCLNNLLEVALNDIFGDITAEKQVQKIAAHTPEAKPSAKSFLVLHIIARKIPETCLLDLLLPFKEHLMRTQSRKVTLKIQQCFGNIVSGLAENTNVAIESLLIFIYGTISESIIDLLPGTKQHQLSTQEKERMRRARPDSLLLQPTPRMRTCAVNRTVQTNNQANAHILIEFGLEMLHIVLKRKKILAIEHHASFINPLLPLLRDALRSTHIRVTTFALKCYATMWHDEYQLDVVQENLAEIVARLFEILKNLSIYGASKQEDNQQLLRAAYKTMVTLLRKRIDYELTTDQLENLLLQIEKHLFEGEQQAVSFSLLKALVARRIKHKSLDEIMMELSKLVVTAEAQHIREEAHQILLLYVLEYALGKRVTAWLKFFSVQLCYELPSGRLSALQFLVTLIRKFPPRILSKHAEFLYISMGTRLVNDDEPECRQAIAAAIELLISRLEKADRQQLFEMTILFFDATLAQNKTTLREMAAALCSRFLVAEKQAFAPRLKLLLPILVARLTLIQMNAPGRFVRAPALMDGVDEKDVKRINKKRMQRHREGLRGVSGEIVKSMEQEKVEKDTLETVQRDRDHEIIQVQYCLLKIFEYCAKELWENEENLPQLDELAYESQRLLAHDHLWVRCNAANILAQILSSYDFNLAAQCLLCLTKHKNNPMEFIYGNPAQDIKSLILDLCAQITPAETPQNLIDDIVKIFLFVANVLREIPFQLKREDSETDTKVTKINLLWLVRQIRFLVNKEVVQASHSTTVRTAFFTLIEGLSSLLDVTTLEKLAPSLLSLLVREMSEEDQQVDPDLRQLALHVGSRLRKRLGADVYDKMRNTCHMQLIKRRVERKKLVAQEKVHDPVRAAKRKAAMQIRKKSAKKLKADVMRGKSADVKKKLKKRKRKLEDEIF